MAGLAGTSPEIIDLLPDETENPLEFYFYDAVWLSVRPVVDTISSEPHNITVSFNSQGMPIDHTEIAALQFKSNDRDNPDLRVPVVMHIVPSAVDESKMPRKMSLKIPEPTPFNASTEIQFSIPASEDIELSIFDDSGRKIRTLVKGKLLAGTYRAVWRGNDDSGKSLPSGIYFVKLSTSSKTILRRTVLVK